MENKTNYENNGSGDVSVERIVLEKEAIYVIMKLSDEQLSKLMEGVKTWNI